MKYELETLGSTSIITLKSDRLDTTNAAELKNQFILISNTDNEHLIVDLADVKMADSSGISALLMAYRIYRDSDRDLLLCNIQENIKKLLEITQLDKLFLMYSDRDEALAFVAEGDD